MSEQNVSIDVSQYLEQKKAGTAKIVKLNGVAHYAKPGFDPETGNPRPVLVPLAREAVVKALESHKSGVETFTQILADVDEAPEKLA